MSYVLCLCVLGWSSSERHRSLLWVSGKSQSHWCSQYIPWSFVPWCEAGLSHTDHQPAGRGSWQVTGEEGISSSLLTAAVLLVWISTKQNCVNFFQIISDIFHYFSRLNMHIHLRISAFLFLLFHLFSCSALSVRFMSHNTARIFIHSVWVHIKKYYTVLDLRLSLWWCWAFRSPAMCCCVTGWVVFVILKELAHWHSILFQNTWILNSVLVYIKSILKSLTSVWITVGVFWCYFLEM